VRIKNAIAIFAAVCATAPGVLAQDKPAPKPQVRVNYLNVCTPTEAEQKEMSATLSTIPVKPALAADFEVSRGRSTVTQASPLDPNDSDASPEKPVIARWVRIRHDIAPGGAYGSAQYSFSADEKGMTETLVLHARDMSVSFQDSVTAGTPAAMLASNTPVDRIRVERNGKSSLVLARCEGADQSKYEPLFRIGSEVLARYRGILRVQQIVPGDLARVTNAGNEPKRTSPR